MEPQAPSSIDKHEIISVLGGWVTSNDYLAYDAFIERQVPIKRFNLSLLSDPEYGHTYRKLINNEASLVGQCNYPNIVGIYDAALSQGS